MLIGIRFGAAQPVIHMKDGELQTPPGRLDSCSLKKRDGIGAAGNSHTHALAGFEESAFP